MQNDISQYRAYSNGLSKLFPVPDQFTNNPTDADSLKEQLSNEEKPPTARKNSKMSDKVTGKGKMPC